MKSLIGKKIGMTQVFDESGNLIPVTALQLGPCVVVQCKSAEKDGYAAVQLGFEPCREKSLSRAEVGHTKKAGLEKPVRHLSEVRLEQGEEAPQVGAKLDVSIFDGVSFVDVVGQSKGRGFQGVVRRHGMGGGRASHGSGFHRRPGSIGMKEWPARVLKGKRMPGHMGNTRVTTQNLKVVQVRLEDNLLLVRGSVPGPAGALVYVKKSLKKADKSS